MKNVARHKERGIALFFSIFALLLLTAIGAALIFMASTETSVNSNYRQEQVAYFAAKAGIEEARARMMASDPNSINNAIPLPTAAPTALTNSIIYITNSGFTSAAVTPWVSTSTYGDQELCHDGYGATGTDFGAAPPDVRCGALPSGAWYTSYTSLLPDYNATNKSAVVPYAWVRIAPKVNNSVAYLNGSTSANYSVKAGLGISTLICWDGVNERLLTAASCNAMVNANNAPMTNVYLVTALGVSSNSPNAARKVVQSEVALQPTAPFPYGMFATSNACPAISFSGNPPSTDSYTTAGGGTYGGANSTTSNWGGDIGSNGGVDIQNGNVGGIVGVLPTACPPSTLFTIGSQGTTLGPNCPTPGGSCVACPGPTGPYCLAGSATDLTKPVQFTAPPAPNPVPPNTTYNPPSCGKKKAGSCMTPGTYGNINLTGTLTLAPGIYNINSLSETGQGTINVSPQGAVVLNIGGCGDATCSAANALANPLNIAGQGAVQIADDGIPNDFLINYAGSGTISIAGKGTATAMLNAPLANITQTGNSQWFGSILASTIHLGGNAFFHFDRASALAPNNNGYYTLISYREVPY